MTNTVLQINSSGRKTNSVTRSAVSQVLEHLKAQHPITGFIDRDLITNIPFINEDWIDANFTAVENRNAGQINTLKGSDQLVQELFDADVVLIGSPIYNFSIPAVLKAWVDQVARAGLTFKYTENGPIGLLKNKKAIVVMASGGVPIGSKLDFATPYLQQVLGFIGINDVTVIDANKLNKQMLDQLFPGTVIGEQTHA